MSNFNLTPQGDLPLTDDQKSRLTSDNMVRQGINLANHLDDAAAEAIAILWANKYGLTPMQVVVAAAPKVIEKSVRVSVVQRLMSLVLKGGPVADAADALAQLAASSPIPKDGGGNALYALSMKNSAGESVDAAVAGAMVAFFLAVKEIDSVEITPVTPAP